MGRRSIISQAAIRSMISAYNRSKREKEFEALVREQNSLKKELPETYEIASFDINIISRVAHVDFIATKMYRKIERYVTHNYERRPIYGNWNSKTRHIKKTLKLSNEELEKLIYSTDPLIRSFATEIIERIDNSDLVPSWFIRSLLLEEKREKMKEAGTEYDSDIHCYRVDIDKRKSLIMENKEKVKIFERKIDELTIENGKVDKKIKKFQKKPNIFITIITVGIISIKNYEKKLNNNIKRREKLVKEIEQCNHEIALLNKSNSYLINEIDNFEKAIGQKNIEKSEKIEKVSQEYDKMISEIEPLPYDMTHLDRSDFIPLKKLIGIKYEKIIGCYIIHNKEFDKYYVGQSKDVIKRVTRDHFSGTTVKNIIFAEDYYNSKYENKDDIFEVKIIRLETKDELDRTEKELIEEYDSFNNGYNGTSGNK